MEKSRFAGAALAAAGGGILIAEAVTASAWTDPHYSYMRNYISDLEVRGPIVFQDNLVHSPLWILMSAAYVLNGALVAAAVTVAIGPRAKGRPARLMWIGGSLYGFGIALAGVFHEVPAGSFPLHAFGAVLIGIPGNITLIQLGLALRRVGYAKPVVASVPSILGSIGLISFCILPLVAQTGITGLVERFAAYPLFLSQLGIGVVLFASTRHSADAKPLTTTARQ
ncbi:DUF998 domain-containing protein [Dactylosporangium sp. CA-092794]|uniref:DUF998 domain-containing protein n=1 Tax=Dactylosporangium sp. CA-092794 TaxID=3239929 RepID=UPI003D8F998E